MNQQMPCLTWAAFKDTCITKKNLTCQYFETANTYELFGQDGDFIWSYTLLKTSPKSEEQTDFEDNHLADFNWVIGSGRPYPFSTSDFDYAADGFKAELTEWTDNHADGWYKIEEDGLYMNGGMMITLDGYAKGDYGAMAIVDKDGLVYPAGTVVKEWIKKRYLHTDGTCECNTPYAGKPLMGFYIRVRYHRADSNNRTIAVNFNLHKAI